MNRLFRYLTVIASVAILAGCASSKDILYFQDIDEVTLNKLNAEYEAVIKKDDRLVILVSGPDKTVCAPYNLTLGEISGMGANLLRGYESERCTEPVKSTVFQLLCMHLHNSPERLSPARLTAASASVPHHSCTQPFPA